MKTLDNLLLGVWVAVVLFCGQPLAKGQKLQSLDVTLFPLDSKLDTRTVRSASTYILLKHLTSTLVAFDKMGRINGQLAESWNSDDQKKFIFELKKNLTFSDGSALDATHVKQSIDRLVLSSRNSIHFNFDSIKSVSAHKTTLKVELKETNSRFLHQLTHPEFGVIHPDDIGQGVPSFVKTSGPYSVLKKVEDGIIFVRNPNFVSTVDYPRTLKVLNLGDQKRWDKVLAGELDFALEYGQLSEEVFQKIQRSEDLTITNPHIGFTQWISLNPVTETLKDQESRVEAFAILNSIDFESSFTSETWKKARQLYLPDGSGHITDEEMASIYGVSASGGVLEGKKLRFLCYQNFFGWKLVKDTFLRHGVQIETVFYKNQSEFTSAILSESFDFVETNNDFSSIDLTENLLVTFNPNRPLVFLGQFREKYHRIMEKMKISSDTGEKSQLAKSISLGLLTDRLIFPISHKRTIFVHRTNLDISEWSVLFPEVAFWKAKWGKK